MGKEEIGIQERPSRAKGRVRFRIHDLINDTWEITPWGHNIVVDDGNEQYVKLMAGDSTAYASYCGVGSGTTAAASTDTALETEIGRIAITDYSIASATCTFSTFFGSADCNGSWNEVGLLTANSGGILINHYILASTITKNSTKTVIVDIELTIT